MAQAKQALTKKICRYLWLTLFSTITVLVMGTLIPTKLGGYSQSGCDFKVCVHDTGIHTNIVLPVQNQIFDWQNYLAINEIGSDSTNSYNYLSFGWGDRDFYMQTPTLRDINLVTTFRALFLPTPSVMEVKGYQQIPNNFNIKCVQVNEPAYLRLIAFIKGSFEMDAQGNKIRISNGHTANAGFYASRGSYSIFRTCNSWTADGLRIADINTPLWDGLSAAVMSHLRSACQSTMSN